MLAAISIITGVCAGTLAWIQAQRRLQQPQKARQLRTLSLLPFSIAGLMPLLWVL